MNETSREEDSHGSIEWSEVNPLRPDTVNVDVPRPTQPPFPSSLSRTHGRKWQLESSTIQLFRYYLRKIGASSTGKLRKGVVLAWIESQVSRSNMLEFFNCIRKKTFIVVTCRESFNSRFSFGGIREFEGKWSEFKKFKDFNRFFKEFGNLKENGRL